MKKILLLAGLGLAIAGCGGGGGGGGAKPIIRFVNGSSDAHPLDFYLDLTKEANAVPFPTMSSAVTIEDGDHDVNVFDSTNSSNLDAQAVTLNKDGKYVAVTVGLENYGSELEKRLRIVTFGYDDSAPNGNQARLLIMHGFSRASGFDTPQIDFQSPGTNPQYVQTAIDFGIPRAMTVDAGIPIELQARPTGSEDVYADATTTFTPGAIYLALVTGQEPNGQIVYIRLN